MHQTMKLLTLSLAITVVSCKPEKESGVSEAQTTSYKAVVDAAGQLEINIVAAAGAPTFAPTNMTVEKINVTGSGTTTAIKQGETSELEALNIGYLRMSEQTTMTVCISDTKTAIGALGAITCTNFLTSCPQAAATTPGTCACSPTVNVTFDQFKAREMITNVCDTTQNSPVTGEANLQRWCSAAKGTFASQSCKCLNGETISVQQLSSTPEANERNFYLSCEVFKIQMENACATAVPQGTLMQGSSPITSKQISVGCHCNSGPVLFDQFLSKDQGTGGFTFRKDEFNVKCIAPPLPPQ